MRALREAPAAGRARSRRRRARRCSRAPRRSSTEAHGNPETAMIIRKKMPRGKGLHEPLLHPDHPKPVTRRQMLAAGLLGSQAYVLVPSVLAGLLAMPRKARAGLAGDIQTLVGECGITAGAGKIPFICF